MSWADYNVRSALLVLEIKRLSPDCFVRIDPLGESWGCSLTPWDRFPDGRHEIYTEAMDPVSAIDAALAVLRIATAAAI